MADVVVHETFDLLGLTREEGEILLRALEEFSPMDQHDPKKVQGLITLLAEKVR